MKIEEKHNRKVLKEGRNYGMGFAFCMKKGDVYETTSPISPCKDYLNDAVFVENTGKEIGTIYGLNYKPVGCLKEDIAYLACSIMHYSNGKDYGDYQKERTALTKNCKAIELGLNYYEDLLKIPHSIIYLVGEDLLIEVPKWWYQEGWRISFYTLVLRSLIYYDGSIPVQKYLKEKALAADKYLLTDVLPKFDKIVKLHLKDKLNLLNFPPRTMAEERLGINACTIHNGGIISLGFLKET